MCPVRILFLTHFLILIKRSLSQGLTYTFVWRINYISHHEGGIRKIIHEILHLCVCGFTKKMSYHSIHPIFNKDLLDSARIAGNLWSMILARIFLTIHIFLRAFRFVNLLLNTHGLFSLLFLLQTTSTILGYDNHCLPVWTPLQMNMKLSCVNRRFNHNRPIASKKYSKAWWVYGWLVLKYWKHK